MAFEFVPLMVRQLTEIQKALIAEDLNNGLTQRRIAEKRNVAKTTVQNIRRKVDKGIPLGRITGSGRPERANQAVKDCIFKLYTKDHFIIIKEIKKEVQKKFNLTLSNATISRILSSFGLLTSRPIVKPLLRPVNISKRKILAEKYLGISNETLHSIVFSDECKFNCYQSDGARFVRHLPGERHKESNIIPSIKHGGGNVMVWGCISYEGVGRLVFIDETMTGANYKQILAQNLEQSVDEMGLSSFIFMHDNDPKHTSRVVQSWLDEKEIGILEWPPQSPDLNPIEHIWAYIKRILSNLGLFSKRQLKLEIERVWNSLTPIVVQPFIQSFHKRVLAIYNAKGKHTTY